MNAEEPVLSCRPTGNVSVIDMRQSWKPGFIPVGIVVALALAFTSAGAQATGGRRIAAVCSNETVNGVSHAGTAKPAVRVAREGVVS